MKPALPRSGVLSSLFAHILWLFIAASTIYLPQEHSASAAVPPPSLIISEFSADNNRGYPDEDGDSSDWIEIYNPTTNSQPLLNWSLSDSRNNLNKWRFPETNIAAGGFLVVFASEKNRTLSGKPLHTNFKLDADGEFLGLTDPTGKTTSQFAPKYPKQVRNVSFGFGLEQIHTLLVSNASSARILIPTNATVDQDWSRETFPANNWAGATASIGFDAGTDTSESQYVSAVQSLAPLIHLVMNETNGTEFANQGSLGTAANGVLAGAVTLNQAGPTAPAFKGFETNNKSFRFSGSGNPGRIRIADSPALHRQTGPFTIGLWMFPTSIATRGDVFCVKDSSSEFSIQTSSTSGNQFTLYHNGVIGVGGSLSNSTWYHLIVTRTENGEIKAYQDGVEIISANDSLPFDVASDFLVGSNHRGTPANGQFGFNGRLDEFMFLDRSISSDEVTFLYQTARLGGARLTGAFQSDLQTSMSGKSSSAYLRIPFVVSDRTEVDRLLLRARYDDGFVAYLNGEPISEVNASAGPWSYNSTARTPRNNVAALQAEEFDLNEYRSLLHNGTNILAIHGLNISATQSDFLIAVELEATRMGSLAATPRYFRNPSPGEANGVGTSDLGPILGIVQHSPAIPADTDPLQVTAEVSPSFQPVEQVQLLYAVNFGTTNVVEMHDDGLSGDGAALDGIYGATIPATAAGPGQLIRYKVIASDAAGASSRWPLFEDPLGSPEFLGTVVEDPALASSKIPIWHWFARTADTARNRTGTRVSVFYNGVYYDNIFARERGGATSTGSQKFDFNRDFRAEIVPGNPKVDEANLNSSGSDATYVRPPLAFATYRRLGNPACLCFPVLMRLNGKADRLANYVEQVDESFLKRNGINDQGVLYKFVQRGAITPVFSDSTDGIEKKTHTDESNQDLQEIVAAIKLPTLAARTRFFLDNFDLANMINFLATRPLTMDADDVRKNFYMYRDREGSGEWMIFPWDKDWTFGITGDGGENLPHPFFGSPAFAKPDTQANVLYGVFFNDAPLREMMLRRLRSVMDELLQPPWIDARDYRYEPWVDELASVLPNAAANAAAFTELKSYFPKRRQDLYVTYNVLGTTNLTKGVVPDPQPGNILIQFGQMEVTPASGNQDEEYFQLNNTNLIAVDVSGWKVDGAVQHTLKPGTVIPSRSTLYVVANSRAFRSRTTSPKGGESLLVQGNYEGRLSSRGEFLTLHDQRGRLVDTKQVQGELSDAQQFLRISEIMFAPSPDEIAGKYVPEDYEFLELANISTSPLDVSGVKVTGAVDYIFTTNPAVVMPAGARWTLVRNLSAFQQRYPTSPAPVGSYTGSLNNSGEKITLLDKRGEKILEFQYEPDWQATTRSLGFALIPVDIQASYDSFDSRQAWRPGTRRQGTPGLGEITAPLPQVVITEVLAHSIDDNDAIEIQNQSPNPFNVGGWYISDSSSNPRRARLPLGTLLQPGGFYVITANQWNAAPQVVDPFRLSSGGEEVYLFAADTAGNLTGYSDGWNYPASDAGSTIGLFRNSLGKSVPLPLSRPTLGSSNAEPALGPIVLGEIHYHPAVNGNSEQENTAEYVEIQNLSDSIVKLTEATQPDVAWRMRGDIQYDFPTNVALAPHGAVLIVPFDPADTTQVQAFVNRHQLRAIPRILGPYLGHLPNNQGHVSLERPSKVAPAELPLSSPLWVVQEEVHYTDQSPWPELADGYGSALVRRFPVGMADDPTSWTAAAPSPGSLTAGGIGNPVITSQPEGRISRAFESTTFSVSAKGTGNLHYQWFLNQSPIPGANSSAYQIRSATSEDEGVYEVSVFDQVGSTLSEQALLSLTYPPIITAPVTNRTVRAGQKTDFRVTALGHGKITYQWFFQGAPIASATNNLYTISSVGPTHVGSYTVQVQDQTGTTLSPPALLTISELPQLSLPPVSVAVVAGQPAVFSTEVKGTPPFTYRWRRGTTLLATETSELPVSFLVITNTSTNALILQGLTNYSLAVNNVAGGITNSFQIILLSDTDKDGMSDAFETQHQLLRDNPEDASLDPDQDGFSNQEEYIARTNPNDAASALRVDWVVDEQNRPALQFQSQAGITYSIEVSSDPAGNSWQRWASFPARSEARTVRLTDTANKTNALFFRVVTPWRP